ncbi:M23 family metallopeptidase [Temperatibacter marinus]|uniref:M23 family metallopeptidase n=1 Tax=Temperatibacter marinus TaxID=1456591 RepID=A0AA52EH03_9PROT|nr:M23 family metallopeptidase [Temperatibacter marinus]WND02620.1 M23 family metallopeptidase [Temperatibacter marinus]
MNRLVGNLLFCFLLGVMLSACTSQSSYENPARIKPVFELRNTPFPVPKPKMRPEWKAKKLREARYPQRYPSKVAQRKKPAYIARATQQSVTVKKGDTLYGLSRRHTVNIRDLARVNKIQPPYALALGQKIKLPSPATHRVKRGDTSYSIAQAYGIRLSDLIRLNRIRPPYSLAVGQSLKLPGGAKITQRAPSSAAPKQSYQRQTAIAKKKVAKTGNLVPPPKTGKYFSWPVKGTIISRFGPKKGGIHNDGINMVASKGTAIRVAETGVVAYASDALPGYGNLILVKHSGNWVTAYAHTEGMKVTPGQVVKKGQVIARVGDSGGVQRPQLHFEIRRGRKALNPLLYLERPQTAAGP